MEGYPLGQLIGAKYVAEKGASNGKLCGNEGGKLDVSPLRQLLGSDVEAEIGSYNGMSDGDRYVKLQGYPLGEQAFGS